MEGAERGRAPHTHAYPGSVNNNGGGAGTPLVNSGARTPYKARKSKNATLPALPPDAKVRLTSAVKVQRDGDGRKQVNQYLVLKTLGRGSSAKVKLVKNTNDGVSYALKVLMRSTLARQRRGERDGFDDVHAEICATVCMNHPLVMRLYEVIDDPACDKIFLVLEYVGGGPLMKSYVNTAALEEAEARALFKDLARGLMFVHASGVLHRDIKPENLLRCEDQDGPSLKISDFGEAHVFGPGGDDSVRCNGGTPAFHAPECCSSNAYSGCAADVWAAGVTLYAMALGRCPFLATTIMDMYRQVVNDEPDYSPAVNGRHISAPLRELLSLLLEKDASRRISLRQALDHPWCKLR